MKEIKCEQLSDEWFELRLGKITGSHFDLIMQTDGQKTAIEKVVKNNEKYKDKPDKLKPMPPRFSDGQLTYLYRVAAELLTNEREETFETKSMRWGTEHELMAKQCYSMRHLVNVNDCGFFTDEVMTGSSPDGIIGDRLRTFEAKCPESKQHFYYYLYPEELFKKYKWQAIGECYFTGIDKGVICSFDPRMPDDKQLVEYEFDPTEEQYTELKYRLKECVYLINEWLEDKPIQVEFDD